MHNAMFRDAEDAEYSSAHLLCALCVSAFQNLLSVLEQKLYLDPADFDQTRPTTWELSKTPDSGMSDSPAVHLNGQQAIVILFSLFNDLP